MDREGYGGGRGGGEGGATAARADGGGWFWCFRVLLEGKVVDLERSTTEGFARGHVLVQEDKRRMRIDFQNE